MTPATGAVSPSRLSSFRRPETWLIPLVLVAFAVRLVQLDAPVLRWDEGWSLAHASLPWPALFQVASEDRHPPLYTALLKLWLVTGKTTFGIRYLSVLLGVLALPLAYQVGLAWSGKRRVALLAALYVALSPLLVYYGQVARMYPLAALLVLAAAFCLLRGVSRPAGRYDLGLALVSAGAMATFYQTLWPLIGLYLYGALASLRRRSRTGVRGRSPTGVWSLSRLILIGLAAVVIYAPWLAYAGTTIRAHVSSGPAAGLDALRGTLSYLWPTLYGLAFPYGSGWVAAAALALVLFLGLLAQPPRRDQARRLLLPLLVIVVTVLGIAYVSQASFWFAVRHLVPAAPFLGLALAWALDGLAARWRPLLPLALVVLAMAYWPTSTRFVYAKSLEVVEPFDPAADYRYLSQHAGPDDLVYFNVLSKAGWYENLRRPGDPAWSYAMRWDPVIEPMPRIAARISRDASVYRRLWFVLYKGTFGPNAPLKEWLDSRYYPAAGGWQEDTLFLAYAVPPVLADGSGGSVWTDAPRDDLFGQVIRLQGARFTPEAIPGGVITVELRWEALGPAPANPGLTSRTGYKVFVHLTDDGGALVTQHDGVPVSGERPTTTWEPGQLVLDRHGLFLPARLPERLRLRVGLYDPVTGQRLRLPDGGDQVEIATLSVASRTTR